MNSGVCLKCGRTVSGRKKYCSECKKDRYREAAREKYRVEKMVFDPRICPTCKNEFKPKRKNQKYCDSVCQQIRNYVNKNKWDFKYDPVQDDDPTPAYESIEEVQRKARAAGLSYGQYVSLRRAV